MLVFPMTFGRQLLFALGVAGPLLTMAQPCEDRNAQCGYWAAIGECQANPSYMLVMCQHSCHSCDKEGAVQERIYQHLEKKIVTGLSDVDRGPSIRELSYSPQAFLIDRFLSEQECEALKTLARPRLHAAKTINRSTGEAGYDKVRTNAQFYLDQAEDHQDPLVQSIVERMHHLARIPFAGHSEPLQVGRYQAGQFYQTHFDSELLQDVRRVATVLIYLDPAEAGGETIFPKHRRCQDPDFAECCTRIEELVVGEGKGFFVKGQKGQAIVFYSHNLDGQHNPLSTHASCPVERGEKWVAQQWFRVEPYAGSPYFKFPGANHS